MNGLHNKLKTTRKRVRRTALASCKSTTSLVNNCAQLSPTRTLFSELPAVTNFVFNGSAVGTGGTGGIAFSAPAHNTVSPQKNVFLPPNNVSMQAWQFNLPPSLLYSGAPMPTTTTFNYSSASNLCSSLAHFPENNLPTTASDQPQAAGQHIFSKSSFSNTAASAPYFVPLPSNMPFSTSPSVGTTPLNSGVQSPTKKHARRYATRSIRKSTSMSLTQSSTPLLNPVADFAAVVETTSVNLSRQTVDTAADSALPKLLEPRIKTGSPPASAPSELGSSCNSCSCPHCIEQRKNADWLGRLTRLKRGLRDLADSFAFDSDDAKDAPQALRRSCDAVLAQLRVEADLLTAHDPGQLYNGLEELGRHWLQKVRSRVTTQLIEFGVISREAAHKFAHRLRTEYAALKSAAKLQARVLITLEREHLSAMGLSWELLCCHWFHTVVFLCTEVCDCTGQLLDSLRPRVDDMEIPSAMSLYMDFDSEMSRVSQEWRRAQAVLECWQDQLAAAAEAAAVLSQEMSPALSLLPRVHPPSLSSTDDSSSPGSCSPIMTSRPEASPLSRLATCGAPGNPHWDIQDEINFESISPINGKEMNSTSCGVPGSTNEVVKDNKYCDCCYCEVFGHGGGGQQPTVSAGYLEQREHLRQRLLRKKAVHSNTECSTSLLTSVVSLAETNPCLLKTPPAESCVLADFLAAANMEKTENSLSERNRACATPVNQNLINKSTPTGTEDLDTLVAYINGSDESAEAKRRASKKNKKARQKARKQAKNTPEQITSVDVAEQRATVALQLNNNSASCETQMLHQLANNLISQESKQSASFTKNLPNREVTDAISPREVKVPVPPNNNDVANHKVDWLTQTSLDCALKISSQATGSSNQAVLQSSNQEVETPPQFKMDVDNANAKVALPSNKDGQNLEAKVDSSTSHSDVKLMKKAANHEAKVASSTSHPDINPMKKTTNHEFKASSHSIIATVQYKSVQSKLPKNLSAAPLCNGHSYGSLLNATSVPSNKMESNKHVSTSRPDTLSLPRESQRVMNTSSCDSKPVLCVPAVNNTNVNQRAAAEKPTATGEQRNNKPVHHQQPVLYSPDSRSINHKQSTSSFNREPSNPQVRKCDPPSVCISNGHASTKTFVPARIASIAQNSTVTQSRHVNGANGHVINGLCSAPPQITLADAMMQSTRSTRRRRRKTREEAANSFKDDHTDPVVEAFVKFVEETPADPVNRVKIPLRVFENLKGLQKKK